MKSQKIAVFGNGHIGTQLTRYFTAMEMKVVSVSRSFQDHVWESESRRQIDIRDEYKVCKFLNDYLPDKVIIATGMGGIRECKRNEEESYRINVESVLATVKECKTLGISALSFSTSLVWDCTPKISNIHQAPRTVYAKHKKEMEAGIEKIGGVNCILRLGKVIDENSNIVRKLQDFAAGRKEIVFYRNLVLAPVHISSVVESVTKWLISNQTGTINLVPRNQHTELEIAKKIAVFLNKPLKLSNVGEILLPSDELPTKTFCPKDVENEPSALYSIDAVVKEIRTN